MFRAFLFVSVLAAQAFAGELLFFDLNKVVTKDDDRGFPGQALYEGNKDWTDPVDYTGGTFHYRVEIRSMPTDQSLYLPLFFWQDDAEAGPPPGSRKLHVFKNAEAVYVAEWSLPFDAMKEYSSEIDWTRARDHTRLAIKNASGGNVTDRGDFDWSGEDPDDWYPMDIRYTAVIVSAGDAFSGWDNHIFDTYTPEPTFVPDGGSYDRWAAAAIACAVPGARIFYTTDGTEPSDESIPYDGPVVLTGSKRLRARAYSDGNEPSRGVQSERYAVARGDGEVTYVEAEDMTLDGFVIDSSTNVDGRGVRVPAGTDSGCAHAVFSGPAGTYDLTLYAVPENDGKPHVTVAVNGTAVLTAVYPMNAVYSPLTFRQQYGAVDVPLAPGDSITVTGVPDNNAGARWDKLKLQAVDTDASTARLPDRGVPYPAVRTSSDGTTVFGLGAYRGRPAALRVYRPDGSTVHTERTNTAPAAFEWDGGSGAGVYCYRLTVDGALYAGRIISVR